MNPHPKHCLILPYSVREESQKYNTRPSPRVLLRNNLKSSVFAVVPGCKRWSQRSSGHPQHRHEPPIKQKAEHAFVYENSTSVSGLWFSNKIWYLSPFYVSVVYRTLYVWYRNYSKLMHGWKKIVDVQHKMFNIFKGFWCQYNMC